MKPHVLSLHWECERSREKWAQYNLLSREECGGFPTAIGDERGTWEVAPRFVSRPKTEMARRGYRLTFLLAVPFSHRVEVPALLVAKQI
jgi:hypothetical protein